MLNPSRACCCVASPCSCGTESGSTAFLPVTGSTFTYEVAFLGYTGKVQLSSIVSGIDIRLAGLPGNTNPGAGDTGGRACVTDSTSGIGCTTCSDAVTAQGRAYISDYDRETTTTDCGFDLTPDAAVFIGVQIMAELGGCGTKTVSGTTYPCYPSYFDDGGSLIPGFITDTGTYTCAALWTINVVGVHPGLAVSDPYSTAATIRFSWNGNLSNSFTPSLTSSTNGPTGSPTISTAGCYYLHRARSTTACANESGGVGPYSNVCTARPLLGGTTAGDGAGACVSNSCCCETEIAIRMIVWQDYYTRGYTAQGIIGNVSGPTSLSCTITAYYRGCHDPRLYSSATAGLVTRTLTLDRATINLATLPSSGKGWTKITSDPVNSRIDADYGNGFLYLGGTVPVESTSTVVDSRTCACTTGVSGASVITAARAIEMGVPEEITVSRITP
jgi:hypothetical protein